MDNSQSDHFSGKPSGLLWGEIEPIQEVKRRGKILMEPPEPSESMVENEIPISVPVEEYSQVSNNSNSEMFDENGAKLSGNNLLRAKMLSCVSKSDAYFKSQQRGEADLTAEEKESIAAEILDTNPGHFLSRYGRYLNVKHMQYFDQFRGNYEVDFYLRDIEKSRAKDGKVLVKNRRYQAMMQLIDKGEYFSLQEMQKRNPLLFQHLVGRYLTAEEQEDMKPAEETCSLSTLLMAHMDRDQVSSTRRKEQEAEQNEWDEEFSESEDEVDGDDQPRTIGMEEKNMLREEFVTSMYRSFLEGKDKEFDYSTVDTNADYDNLTLRERDDEERYFDQDEFSDEDDVTS